VTTTADRPLHVLLGGPYGAVESALPSVVFVTAYLVSGASLTPALVAAMTTAAVLAGIRLVRRERPVRVVGGLLAVSVAALVAARTGNAVDYFLPSLLANIASALAWALSILVRWPLLGVIVGVVVRTGTTWRGDPDLLRAYSRASWVWTASFVVRAAVQVPLYLDDQVVWLGVARVALGWPLVLGVIALSWVVIRRTLPTDHPGLNHPRVHRGTGTTPDSERQQAGSDA
jgi:Protein of unknown function (DUF3159)